MIRLAFLLVTLLGGLIAFGAFYLVRGEGSAPVPAEVAQPEAPRVEAEPELVAGENFYFLQELTLEGDAIALVLFNVGDTRQTLVVRDPMALTAARDTAFIAPSIPRETFALYDSDTQLTGAFLHVYRNDTLIEMLVCPNTNCANLIDVIEVDFGGLLDTAIPAIPVEDVFGNHDDYLATIQAIAQDPDFMLLDLRRSAPFPLEQQPARMELALPTIVSAADATFDPNVTSALASSIVEPLLPDGATISEVVFTTAGEGFVADGDSGTPVLAGGARISFPAVTFTSVTVSIEGTATLNTAALDSLSSQPLQRTDYEDAFETFVTQRLQSSCADCFTVKMNGDFYDEATIIASQAESYRLDYYDLREAP